MEYRSAKGFTGWGQTGMLVAFIGVGLILAGIVQLWIGLSLIAPGIPPLQKADAMLKALFKPENVGWLQISQVISTFFLFFLPTVFYSLVCNGKHPLWLGFSRHINFWQVLLGFFIIFCANIASEPIADLSKKIIAHFPSVNNWAQGLEDSYNSQVTAMSNLKGRSSLVLAIVVLAFFPALFEEILFRGAIQNLFIKWWKKPLLGIIITSLVFSFIHGEAYPFLSRAILGFVLGLMYYQSKNLWVNIIAHFLNNAIAVIQLYAAGSQSTSIPAWIGFASIPLLYFLFLIFKKISAKNKAMIETDELKLWIKSTPQYNLAETNNLSN